MNQKSLKPLAVTFALGGIWDTIAGFMYFFVIGTGRKIDAPEINPFFSIFPGSFFICFAYLQFLSAFNISRYAFNVGCLIIGSVFYITQLYAYMCFKNNFPATFWFTGIIEGLFLVLYIIFAVRGGLTARDLFLPKTVPHST